MAGILSAIEVSARGLSVQRTKMNVVAENIANAETTRTKEGGPYKRQRVVVEEDKIPGSFKSQLNQASIRMASTNEKHLSGKSLRIGETTGISASEAEVINDPDSKSRIVYDPSHPDANEEGYVEMPDIEIVNEMVDMMAASRGYEANTVAISTAKDMAKNALDI